MKILFTGVYPHLYGGLERFSERAADALRRAGHDVVCAGDPPENAGSYDFVLMQKVPPSLSALRRLKAQCGGRLRFYAHDHELYCLRRHYYDPLRRPCSRTYSFFPCRLCAAVTRPSYLLHNLTRDVAGFIGEMRGVRTFVASRFMKDNLVANGFPPESVEILCPLFVPALREEAAAHRWMEGGRLRILFMGQLIAGKGAGLLLDASRLVKVPHALTLVGRGRDEKTLRRSAPPDAVFAGWRDDAQSFFAHADACAVPSLWHEPFGLVGAEALSHGVPVVAFDTGGLSDLVVPGETGVFARAPDGSTRTAAARTPQAFAAALDSIASPDVLSRLSAGALDAASRLFDPAAFVPRLLGQVPPDRPESF